MLNPGSGPLRPRALVVDDALAKLDAADSPQIEYLKSMQARERQFPGFAGVIEGAEMVDGVYHVLCVKK